jgi:hypothetical protein
MKLECKVIFNINIVIFFFILIVIEFIGKSYYELRMNSKNIMN